MPVASSVNSHASVCKWTDHRPCSIRPFRCHILPRKKPPCPGLCIFSICVCVFLKRAQDEEVSNGGSRSPDRSGSIKRLLDPPSIDSGELSRTPEMRLLGSNQIMGNLGVRRSDSMDSFSVSNSREGTGEESPVSLSGSFSRSLPPHQLSMIGF